jgi:hypothetical protein
MDIAEHEIFKRTWRVSHELPDENKIAFFDEAQSELVVVNALGGAIWQLLDGKLSVRDICVILCEDVQGAPPSDQVGLEVRAFLSSLLERKAITRVT